MKYSGRYYIGTGAVRPFSQAYDNRFMVWRMAERGVKITCRYWAAYANLTTA